MTIDITEKERRLIARLVDREWFDQNKEKSRSAVYDSDRVAYMQDLEELQGKLRNA